MKKLLVPVAALLAILLLPTAEATTTQAKGRALKIAQALKKQGISFQNDYWHGLLRKDGITTLKAGTQYVLVGGGCSDAYDVDIIIYDENMNEVGRDTKVDAVPVIRIKPKWPGTFHVKMKMANSTRNGAHYRL